MRQTVVKIFILLRQNMIYEAVLFVTFRIRSQLRYNLLLLRQVQCFFNGKGLS